MLRVKNIHAFSHKSPARPRSITRMTAKSLSFLVLSCLSLHAAEAPVEAKKEYIRVTEDASAAKLQTSVVTMEKDGRTVDLIGAIHIADKAYYTELNERFTQYDRVLFEMVGGEKIGIQEEAAEETKEAAPEKNKLSGLRDIYAMVSKFLSLSGQAEAIDYKAKNFVHADLSVAEFEEKQKARNESLLGIALKAGEKQQQQPGAKQPDAAKLLAAMLSGNSNQMKLELIHTLGEGEDQISMFAGETAIVTDRNAKCLEVMEAQLAQGHKNLGIFYGSAHFPEMEKSLAEKGWKRTKEQWLTAWDIPKVKKAPIAPEKKPETPAAPKKKAA